MEALHAAAQCVALEVHAQNIPHHLMGVQGAMWDSVTAAHMNKVLYQASKRIIFGGLLSHA